MRMRHWSTAVVAPLIVGLALAACEPAEETPAAEEAQAADSPAAGAMAQIDTASLPPGVTVEMVRQGQQIFTGQGICYTCHGMDGTGTQLAPNLTDQEWLNIDGSYQAIVDLIPVGVPQPKQYPAPMPPMGGAQLSEDQINAVAAYVYTLSH
jgi:mono/diheme cytochrome c family protein